MKHLRLSRRLVLGAAVACLAAGFSTPLCASASQIATAGTDHAVLPVQQGPARQDGYTPPWPSARLRIRVIDGRTMKPLPGAEVVLLETEKRLRTGADGFTPWFDAPVIRNPRFRPMVAELHGQLSVIAYKNGYRDSVHMGIRMHEGEDSEATVWMYKIGPEDRRIEPVLYQVPYHRIWLIELADKFRRQSQLGEGWQDPNR
jgi:hypothetical protein